MFDYKFNIPENFIKSRSKCKKILEEKGIIIKSNPGIHADNEEGEKILKEVRGSVEETLKELASIGLLGLKLMEGKIDPNRADNAMGFVLKSSEWSLELVYGYGKVRVKYTEENDRIKVTSVEGVDVH